MFARLENSLGTDSPIARTSVTLKNYFLMIFVTMPGLIAQELIVGIAACKVGQAFDINTWLKQSVARMKEVVQWKSASHSTRWGLRTGPFVDEEHSQKEHPICHCFLALCYPGWRTPSLGVAFLSHLLRTTSFAFVVHELMKLNKADGNEH